MRGHVYFCVRERVCLRACTRALVCFSAHARAHARVLCGCACVSVCESVRGSVPVSPCVRVFCVCVHTCACAAVLTHQRVCRCAYTCFGRARVWACVRSYRFACVCFYVRVHMVRVRAGACA